MRTAEIKRTSTETDISIKLNIDGKGEYTVNTGCEFFDHMLSLFAKHGSFDLDVKCNGDIGVDAHHTVEDVAMCLGQAFLDAAGDKAGICRYGDIILPMDESLIMCAVDFGGRSYLGYDVEIRTGKCGTFDTELCEEFMQAFVRYAKINLHIRKITGTNAHHIIEGCFKALARTLKKALTVDESLGGALPTTKGVF